MKRLFNRFEKETGLVTATIKKMNGYVEPPPPPLKWHEKVVNFFRGLFGKKRTVKPTWIPSNYGELSIAFNEWLTTFWMQVAPRDRRNQPHPFGERINKHIIRKWTLNYELH